MSTQRPARGAGPSAPPPDQRPDAPEEAAGAAGPARRRRPQPAVPEIGGRQGPEPTRYGDWEKGGRCTDF